MTVWKSFGVSVIGPKHIREGKPNQDSWTTAHHTWGDGIIVSDGVGLETFSEYGSDAACRAAVCAARAYSNKTETEQSFLSGRIKSNWLSFIAPLESHDCSATCLYAFRFSDGTIKLGMLGDGLIAVLKNDDTVLRFTEDKTDSFSNLTSALSKNITSSGWRFYTVQENFCQAVLLCTDGVSDDLTDTDSFVRDFVAYTVNSACISASRNTRIMLENWPTPKHSDDKTIACLFRKELDDE